MKKQSLLSSSSTAIYLFVLFLPLLMQSCASISSFREEFEASGDESHQVYKGPSYPDPSPDKGNIGPNLIMSVWFGSGPQHYNPAALNKTDFYKASEFYALNTHGASAFTDELLKETEQSVNTYEPFKNKSTSKVMSYINGRGGIGFVQKKSKDGGTKITLNYLEVPLYALYNYQLPTEGNIFGGLGPYFAYGIGGKMKSAYNGQTVETKSFDKTNGFKPFDAGLGLTAGYQIPNSVSFRFAYEIGFVNILRNAFGDKAKNRSISLNVGYPLNKIFKG